MGWSDQFVGIPQAEHGRSRSGSDCWGLACIIYRETLGIRLPEYLDYTSTEEHGEIAAVIAGASASPLWRRVLGSEQPFDIAVFRRGRLSTHVGIVIRSGLMIHMLDEDQSKVQTYRDGPWKHRLSGFYRHASMPL